MKALLLAAGFGTRLQPHTLKTAKPAMPFLKLPLLSYPLALLEQVGVTETIINTHHLPETVVTAAESLRSSLKMKISFSHETPHILDSAGALDPLRSRLAGKEPFLMVNADTVLCFQHSHGIQDLLAAHKQNQALATLLTCQHPEVGKKFGGVWVDADSKIHSIGKTPMSHDSKTKVDQLLGLHYTGFMVLDPKVLNLVPKNRPSHIFKDVLEPAIKNGEKVMSHCESMEWYETGDWESFKDAEKTCSKFLNSAGENSIKLAHKILSRN